MKKTIIIIVSLFVSGLLAIRCTTQKRVEYVIPVEYTGQTRENMEKMLIAGQKLYKIYCSSCHGIFTDGKENIPNFSKTQIEAYKSSALLDDPKNHAVAQKIRPDDLDLILQFLAFRKMAKQ